MNKYLPIILIIILIVTGALCWFYFGDKLISAINRRDQIVVYQPKTNQIVSSPLLVKGEARGTWYFEASFPVMLLDGNENELIVKPAQAIGEWMTENFVPFEVTLEFSTPTTETGTLVLKKDNPSGLPEYDDEIRIPVKFR